MSSTRILSILAVALLVGLPPVHAQSDQTSAPLLPDRNYQLLRGDENWSFLRDPALRQDFWDPLKYIPLRRDSPRLVPDDQWGGARSVGADRQQQLGRTAILE